MKYRRVSPNPPPRESGIRRSVGNPLKGSNGGVRARIVLSVVGFALAVAYPSILLAVEQKTPGSVGQTSIENSIDASHRGAITRSDRAGVLAKQLASDNYETRIDAIVAIVDAGFDELNNRIWPLVNDPAWPVAYTALRALSRSSDERTISRLKELATNHWALTVQTMSLSGPETGSDLRHPEPLDRYSWLKALQIAKEHQVADECPRNEYKWKGRWQPLVGTSVFPPPNAVKDIPTFYLPAIGSRSAGLFDAGDEFESASTVVKAVRRGWIVGGDWGEFGGVLLFLSKKGTPAIIEAGMQADGIYETNRGIVVTQGANHRMFSPEYIYVLVPMSANQWHLQLLTMTEIADGERSVTADGNLVINDLSGILVLSERGIWEHLVCR